MQDVWWHRGEARVTTRLCRVVANLCIDRLRRGPGIATCGAGGMTERAAGVTPRQGCSA